MCFEILRDLLFGPHPLERRPFPSHVPSLEFYDPAFINSLKKEKDYIDIEGHVVPEVKELPCPDLGSAVTTKNG